MKHVKLFEEFVNEAFIGPFVFNDSMTDEELKAIYQGALDGFAYWQKGFEYPKADYKKAYIEIEAILKKRGIKESVNENAKKAESDLNAVVRKLERNEDVIDISIALTNNLMKSISSIDKTRMDSDEIYDINNWLGTILKSLNSKASSKLKEFVNIDESPINEAKILTRDEMMATMRSKYGLDFVKTTEEFDGEEGGIWLGGSDDLLMPNAKDMMFNYYHGGSKYPQGVHKDLAKFLDKCGWYGQFADPGTVMLWPK